GITAAGEKMPDAARRHLEARPRQASLRRSLHGDSRMPLARLLPLLLAVIAAIATAALPGSAAAVETGTPAWLISGQALFQGPGPAYPVTGELGDATRIRVDRCTDRWCRIHAVGQRGWVSRDNVGFGQHPLGPLPRPRLGYERGGPGHVCFHEGRHFSGDSLCVTPGSVAHDLQ